MSPIKCSSPVSTVNTWPVYKWIYNDRRFQSASTAYSFRLCFLGCLHREADGSSPIELAYNSRTCFFTDITLSKSVVRYPLYLQTKTATILDTQSLWSRWNPGCRFQTARWALSYRYRRYWLDSIAFISANQWLPRTGHQNLTGKILPPASVVSLRWSRPQEASIGLSQSIQF